MQSTTQVRAADWRALMSAAFIGSGVGLSLGVAYLAAGMSHAAAARELAASALRPEQEPVVASATAAAPDPFARPAPTAQLAMMDPDARKVAQARPARARELDCLTQAVYFEARGESARGQAAVATVIMNRVKNPAFPKTVCGVVYQGASRRNGCQFSFACDGLVERVVENSAWSQARKVAARTLSGAVLRDVGSATHFHTTGVSPEWGSRMLRVAQVGLHVFYRFNPHAPRRPAADDAAVFTSAPAAAPELRLAAALSGPAADAAQSGAPAASPQPASPVTHTLSEKPGPRIEAPSPPVAKADTLAPPKPQPATS